MTTRFSVISIEDLILSISYANFYVNYGYNSSSCLFFDEERLKIHRQQQR
jgi:hypothetical protein